MKEYKLLRLVRSDDLNLLVRQGWAVERIDSHVIDHTGKFANSTEQEVVFAAILVRDVPEETVS